MFTCQLHVVLSLSLCLQCWETSSPLANSVLKLIRLQVFCGWWLSAHLSDGAEVQRVHPGKWMTFPGKVHRFCTELGHKPFHSFILSFQLLTFDFHLPTFSAHILFLIFCQKCFRLFSDLFISPVSPFLSSAMPAVCMPTLFKLSWTRGAKSYRETQRRDKQSESKKVINCHQMIMTDVTTS